MADTADRLHDLADNVDALESRLAAAEHWRDVYEQVLVDIVAEPGMTIATARKRAAATVRGDAPALSREQK
jgi:hypothetical protein